MKIAFCVFVLLCLINASMVSSVGLESPKSCAHFEITAMKGFNKKRFLGSWFTHELFETHRTEDFHCYVMDRKLRPDGNMDETDTMYRLDGSIEAVYEGLSAFNHPGEGRYTFIFKADPTFHHEYFILKTDYRKYSVECACEDVDGGSILQLYVFTRHPTVSRYTQSQIDKVTDAFDFHRDDIRRMNITSCPEHVKPKKVGFLAGLLKLVTDLLAGVLGAVGGLLGGLLG